MLPLASLGSASACFVLLALGAGGCRTAARDDQVPAAEFIVTAGDSAFWVSADSDHYRVRRAPITLAHVDGRFYEVYVADDDRSYYDALLIGQRIYRRDLVSGDSLQVYENGRVARIAREYAAAHPREQPLEPDEDGSEEPHTVATSDAAVLDVLGPMLSFEQSTDIDIADVEDSHIVRHGVIDLRDGSAATLHDVFGDTAAQRIVAEGRGLYRTVIDSVRRARGARGRRAARAIDAFRFDSSSFAIEDIDGAPVVAFYVPGLGESGGGLELPLPSVRAPLPAWWPAVAPTVPVLGPDSASEVWNGTPYQVVARYDTSGDFAAVVVRDAAQREWIATRIPTPARVLYRLDGPGVDSTTRRALGRAFDESTLYSGSARTVRGPVSPRGRLVLVRGRGARNSGSARSTPTLTRCVNSRPPTVRPGRSMSVRLARATPRSSSVTPTAGRRASTATPGTSPVGRRPRTSRSGSIAEPCSMR